MFLDFQALKAQFPIEDAIPFLGLNMKKQGDQYRSQCPKCGGSDRSLAVTPGKGFKCFQSDEGGDVIALVAHILSLRPKEAAEKIAEHIGMNGSEKPKSEPKRQDQPTGELQPLSYLQHDHQAVPVTEEMAEKLGLGYAPRGIMRQCIAVPLRTPDGELVGYLGLSPDVEVRLPKNLQKT